MVKVKMMNENMFSKLMKEYAALGELIRTRQEEKQSVLDEFDKEVQRYKKGKISENTLASSVKKTNAELVKLDRSIRDTIVKCNKFGMRVKELIVNQRPIIYKARETGASLALVKKKAPAKKKAMKKMVKKKAVSKKKTVKKKAKISKAEIKREMESEKVLIQ